MACSGQTPTPAQGRDYINNLYRVVRVDSQGRLEVTGSVSGGCVGTAVTPCVVEGVAAAGAAIAGKPLQVGGSDGTNARYFLVDSAGRLVNVGAAADGAAVVGAPLRIAGKDAGNLTQDIATDALGGLVPALASLAGADAVSNTVPTPTNQAGAQLYYRMLPSNFNGSTNERVFTCPNPAAVSVAGSGTTQVIALSGSTKIRLCGVYLTTAGAVNISFVRGTGSNCGTGTAAIGGVYQVISSIALDFGPAMALTTAAGDAVCMVLGSAVSTTGTLVYAQF